MSKKRLQMPKFKSESEEADWWASPTIGLLALAFEFWHLQP